MDEEITPTETPTDQTDDLTPTDDLLTPQDDVTNLIDPEMIVEVVDKRTLMGTTLHYVFGNVDVMVFIVSIMILVTVLIIGTDFMRWKGRE